ncbi:glycosyltransferase family A protein [Polynucleobacter sp. IMCC 29146]|uniref:glycosyltransferase family 2 protein n=1 Tax=Polynucleobacter sp. IMCC 29146 TaxID=2780953 RepID=UPI001F468B1A|nr:glycosyltransferase family A protein [Polynucleobacter sp. IMCC 29146]MCE7530508.1 glycosyltransferase family 2 protein [Polynucleobacter sp. IMCC 29146]
MSSPKVSVILPAFNAAAHLGKAIDSILSQSFNDFELIIINDGSTDNTLEVLAKYGDPRIKVITQENLGLPKALNQGLAIARGPYIARQDADDISLPTRLEKQVQFLDQNPEYGLIGTWSQIMTPAGLTDRQHLHPTSNGQIQVQLLMNNQFVHSSVMFRASCLKTTGQYSEDPEHFPPEDYDLWLKIAKHFMVANLPEVLLQYLEEPNSISRTKLELINTRAALMSEQAIDSIPGLHANPNLIKLLIQASNGRVSKIGFMQFIRLQNAISKIQAYMKNRFPGEENNIAKGITFLRKQATKAFIKAHLPD